MSDIKVSFGGVPIVVQLGENTQAALDASARAVAAAAAATALYSSTTRSGTIADREAIPVGQRKRGLRFLVTDITPWRVFEWRLVGDPSGAKSDGPVLTAADWVGLYTAAEEKNLGIGFTGSLPFANVAGLTEGYAATDALAAIKIADFRALALSTDTNPKVELTWGISGVQPASQLVSWGGFSVPLSGGARSFTPKDWAAVKQQFFVGNSLTDPTGRTDGWAQLYSTALGVGAVYTAKWSSDARQVYRAGVTPLYLTLQGNTLPAGGTARSISAINGSAPNADATVSPQSWLNEAPGATGTGNVSQAGTIVDGAVTRHGIAAIPNGGSTAYTFTQDAGGAPLTLSGPVLFIPDVAQELARSDLNIWLGNNYFFSSLPNSYGDYTNPQLWVDLAAIIAKAAGNRVLILPVLPSADFVDRGVGTAYNAYLAANARTKALYPSLWALDTAGRDLIQRLQASGDGSANDNADIANGFIPRSLRADSLHLNTAGYAIVSAFMIEARARQALPPAITQSTVFTLTATGFNPRTGDALVPAIATGVVQAGALTGIATALQPGAPATAISYGGSNVAAALAVIPSEQFANTEAQQPNLFTAGELDTTTALRRDAVVPNAPVSSTFNDPTDGVIPAWALTVPAGTAAEYGTQLGPFDASEVFDANGFAAFSVKIFSLTPYSGPNTGVTSRVLMRQYNASGAEITSARQSQNLLSDPAGDNPVRQSVKFSGVAKDASCATVRILLAMNNQNGTTARTMLFGQLLLRKGRQALFSRPPIIIPSPSPTYWVDPAGSGSNSGSYASPITLAAAWAATASGGGSIRIKGGLYDLAASLDPAGRFGLTKLIGEQGDTPAYDTWPRLRRVRKFAGITRVAGYNELCQCTVAGSGLDISLMNWLIRADLADPRADAVIQSADRDPMHRGLSNRMFWGTRMVNGRYADYATAAAAIEGSWAAGDPKSWKNNAAGIFYFPVEAGTDVSTITVYFEESVGLFAAATARRCGEIELQGLSIFGGANLYPFSKAVLDEVWFNGARENCGEGGVVVAGKIRGSASGAGPLSTATVGDVFNTHKGGKWTVDEVVSWCAKDDGLSPHEGCTINIRSGLIEYCGGSAVAVAYGADATLANIISRKNQQIAGRKAASFLSLGAANDAVNTGGNADNMADTNMRLHGCIDYGSDVSFAGANGSAQALATAIGCKSINPVTRGYQGMALMDCGGVGNGLLKSGCTILNTATVT